MNAEPYFNFIQSENNRLKLHASLNVIMYYFDGSGISSGFLRDSTEFEQVSDKPKNVLQIVLEPSLGVSYLIPIQNGDYYFV